MPRTLFRDARRSDVDALAAIEAACFAGDRLTRRSFARLTGADSAALRVALRDRKLAGYSLVLFRKGSGIARLYSIAVDPGERRAGLAAALLDDAVRLARRRGARTMRLEVRTDNAGAIRLYAGAGFTPIGRRPAYYADGADALLYELPLGGRRPAARAATRPAAHRLPPSPIP